MKIFYHNDNDGKAAAAVIFHHLRLNGLDIVEEDFISVNYNENIPTADQVNEYDHVFIVDYSFTENTVQNLIDISKKVDGNVWWYDHHKSSLEVYEKVLKNNICYHAIVDTDRSGAKIVFDVFLKNNNNIPSYMAEVINLVDDYDRWIHNDPRSLLFNIGSAIYDTSPLSAIWTNSPEEIINAGYIINKHNFMTNTKLALKNAYPIKINGHFCMVFNTPVASSQAFGEIFDQFKFAMRFAYNGKTQNFEYSIYSELEDIDCAKIAKYLNPKGGGHKGAAGFVSDKMILYPGAELIV